MQTPRAAEALLSSLWYDIDQSQAEAARLRQQAEQAHAAAANSRRAAHHVTAAWQQYKQQMTEVIAGLSKPQQLSQVAIDDTRGQQATSNIGSTKGRLVSWVCPEQILPASLLYRPSMLCLTLTLLDEGADFFGVAAQRLRSVLLMNSPQNDACLALQLHQDSKDLAGHLLESRLCRL